MGLRLIHLVGLFRTSLKNAKYYLYDMIYESGLLCSCKSCDSYEVHVSVQLMLASSFSHSLPFFYETPLGRFTFIFLVRLLLLFNYSKFYFFVME